MRKIAYITHQDCIKHQGNEGHPEQPDRLNAIHQRLQKAPLWPQLIKLEAPLATKTQLSLAHDADYIESLLAKSPAEGLVQLDEDTIINPHSIRAASLAAGSVVKAVDIVMNEAVDRAFCAVRPPGHHAEYDKAMGFCLFNSIAIGACHAMREYGLKRVAIIDFDVHHGNGTEDIFKDDERVLFCSSFEHPLYPFSGADSSNDHIANLPLDTGTDSQTFKAQLSKHWFERIEQFKPELIFISAGFDAHKDDPLAGLNLVEEDYAWLTGELVRIAKAVCHGRIVSSLEGGYNLSALAESVTAHLTTLME